MTEYLKIKASPRQCFFCYHRSSLTNNNRFQLANVNPQIDANCTNLFPGEVIFSLHIVPVARTKEHHRSSAWGWPATTAPESELLILETFVYQLHLTWTLALLPFWPTTQTSTQIAPIFMLERYVSVFISPNKTLTRGPQGFVYQCHCHRMMWHWKGFQINNQKKELPDLFVKILTWRSYQERVLLMFY